MRGSGGVGLVAHLVPQAPKVHLLRRIIIQSRLRQPDLLRRLFVRSGVILFERRLDRARDGVRELTLAPRLVVLAPCIVVADLPVECLDHRGASDVDSLNFFAVAVAAPLTFAPPRRLKSRTIAAFVGVSMPVDPTVFGMIAKARERPQHRRFGCEEDKTVDGFEYSMFETKL